MSESEFNKLNFVGQNDLNWSQLLKSSWSFYLFRLTF
jgi:hypothetical protein